MILETLRRACSDEPSGRLAGMVTANDVVMVLFCSCGGMPAALAAVPVSSNADKTTNVPFPIAPLRRDQPYPVRVVITRAPATPGTICLKDTSRIARLAAALRRQPLSAAFTSPLALPK